MLTVKSGHNAHLRSLHSFLERLSQSTGIRVWSQPYSVDIVITLGGKECRLVNLLFNMVGELDEILKNW